MTAQGQPRTIFRRAVERGNLIVAEGMVREMGQITLAESLALTALAARIRRSVSTNHSAT